MIHHFPCPFPFLCLSPVSSGLVNSSAPNKYNHNAADFVELVTNTSGHSIVDALHAKLAYFLLYIIFFNASDAIINGNETMHILIVFHS